MSRILISAVPASGHINPLLAIAQALREEGNLVTFSSAQDYAPQIERAGFPLYPMAYENGAVKKIHDAFRRPARWISQVSPAPPQSAFFKDLDALTASLIATIERFQPDVLVNDMNQYAGPIAADYCGLPYAGYSAIANPILSRDCPPFGMGLTWAPPGHWRRWLWKPLRWPVNGVLWRYDRLVNRVRQRFGLLKVQGALLTHSPWLTLIPTTQVYEYPRSDLPPMVMYVGPVTTTTRGEIHDDFPWEWFDQDPRPTLYVSMGTIVHGTEVFRYVVELAKQANWRAVVAVGHNTDPRQFDPLPANILMRQFVPQLDILSRVDAVISHGGNNTVTETLLHGLPLVVIPISADQPDSAGHVAASGAGIRLSPWRLTPAKLGKAIKEVLQNPHYRQAAQRVQASYQACAGPQTSARLIELLAHTRQAVVRPAGMPPTVLPGDVETIAAFAMTNSSLRVGEKANRR
jgi:MGT family glycosyltransferase